MKHRAPRSETTRPPPAPGSRPPRRAARRGAGRVARRAGRARPTTRPPTERNWRAVTAARRHSLASGCLPGLGGLLGGGAVVDGELVEPAAARISRRLVETGHVRL